MSIRGKAATDNFMRGYNCAQSVFLAFTDLTGFSPETALKLASSFGAGFCRLRETCGAVSGMAMIYGSLYGFCSPDDLGGKTRQYVEFQQLALEFERRCGSLVCRELLGLDVKHDDPVPAPRTPDYYKNRRCVEYITTAAEIMEDFIAKKGAEYEN